MPLPAYGHMEIFRLSPTTGEILTKLNVFQGQILHGRVFRAEPLSQAESAATDPSAPATPAGSTDPSNTTASADPHQNFLLKIALGTQLIEAVVDEMIPEGSRITLEVLKLADDSLILKLMSVDSSPKQTQTSGAPSSSPDLADLSAKALDAQVPRAAQAPQAPIEQRLVTSPQWTSLPRALVQAVRAAIAEEFIDPAAFSARVPEAKASIQAALSELADSVAKAIPAAQGETKALAESVLALTDISRSIVKSIPDFTPVISESTSEISDTLVNLSAVLRPSLPPSSVPFTQAPTETTSGQTQQPVTPVPTSQVVAPATVVNASPVAEATVKPAPSTPNVAGSVSQPDQPAESAKTVAAPSWAKQAGTSRASDTNATTASKDQPAQTVAAKAETPQALIATAKSGPLVAAPADSGGQATKAVPLPDEKLAGPALPANEQLAPTDQQAQESHPSRDILLAMRTLSEVATRLARSDGLTIEQSAELGRHASRIGSLSDAWEGTLVAPMLTRSLDIPEAVPRLLMNLLFPGGTADLAVVERDRERRQTPGKQEGDESQQGENRYSGVIRLNTSVLGQVRIRLDYRENESTPNADSAPRVGGRFSASGETADTIRAGLPALERALEARGIETEGFQVDKSGPARISADSKPPGAETERKGGLDIHA